MDLIHLPIKPLEWHALRSRERNHPGDYFELENNELYTFRYTVTEKVALDVFIMVAQIGEDVLNGAWGVEGSPLWSEFAQTYGPVINQYSIDGGVNLFDSMYQFPFAAMCLRLASYLKQGDYESIKATSIILPNNQVTFLPRASIFQPFVDISQLVGLINSSAWNAITRDWISQVFAYFFGQPFITMSKDKMLLELPGLQSAVWLAFWNNIYPQPKKNTCKDCNQPIETGKQCRDCKRKTANAKRARNRESLKRRKSGSTSAISS